MLQVTNLKATPLTRGHCVNIEWDNPDTSFKEIVVHRRVDEFSLDEGSTMSIEVYRGTGESIIDYHKTETAVTNEDDLPEYTEDDDWLEGEKMYYYTIFVVDDTDTYHASYGTTIAVSPTKKYGLGDWLYRQLPNVYKRKDREDSQNKAIKKLCDLIGEEIDFMYSKTNMLNNINNPDKTNPDNLDLIADYLGYNLNRTLPLSIQRRLLKNAVNIYKHKGTKKGLSALVKYYSGFLTSSGVYEETYKILRTLDFGYEENSTIEFKDSTCIDFTNFDESLIGTVDDPLDYMWDFSSEGNYSSNKYVAYIKKTAPLTTEQEQDMINRVDNVLEEYTPVGVDYEIKVY